MKAPGVPALSLGYDAYDALFELLPHVCEPEFVPEMPTVPIPAR